MIEWKTSRARYVTGQNGYFGRWKVFSIEYDGCTVDDDKIIAYCMLPGIQNHLGHYKDYDSAKIKAEEVLQYWIEGTVETNED